jgi:hypothetical protein
MKREYEHELISLYPEMFMGSVWEKSPSWFQKLYNRVLFWLQLRYPYFRKFNHKKGVNPYHFGFECGDGWKGILHELISKIKVLDEQKGVVTQVIQVKEKFGGLRFYPLNGGSNEVWKLITEYEEKSYGVCEFTGSRNSVGMWTYGWMSTMSKKYAEEHYQKRKSEGRIPNGMVFEDCWKPAQAAKTIVLNKKSK